MSRAVRTGLVVFALALAGCRDGPAPPQQADENAEIEFVQGQGSVEQLDDGRRRVAKLAIETLAAELDVPEREILVDTVRAVEWRDSSIGCPQPGQAYLQVITPGHKVTLRHDGKIYFVHEANGRAAVCRQTKAVGGVTPELELVWGEQMLAARRDLASRLGVEENEIRLVSALGETWDDESLGCPQPGVDYRERRVEGYTLTLRHGGRDYSYHTDLAKTIPCPDITES